MDGCEQGPHCCADCGGVAGEGVSIRHASRVCSIGTATPIVNGIIGGSIRKNASNVLPSYMTRRFQGPAA